MNLLTLRKKFNKKVFGNSSDTRVSSDEINDSINEAQQQFFLVAMDALGWEVNGEIATTSVVESQAEYIYPSGLMTVKEVKVNDVVLNDTQYKSFDKSLYLLDSTLYEEDLTDGIQITYQEEYTDLVDDTDVPEMPNVFHQYLYKYAAKEYCEDKEMWKKANSLSIWLEKEEDKIDNHYTSKTTQSYNMSAVDDCS